MKIRTLSKLIGASLLVVASSGMQAAPTNGDDFLFFQGTLEQLTTTLVNAYSGDSIYIDEEKLINTGVYDGLGGFDTLILTSIGDYLAVENTVGVQLFSNVEEIRAGNDADVINLSSNTVILNDVNVLGGFGDDIVWGNSGNDTIAGFDGNDIIDGGPGNDILRGENDDDQISGGAGDDTFELSGIFGNDIFSDTTGFDEIFFTDAGVTFSDLFIQPNGLDLLITEINGLGSINITDQFQGGGLLAINQLRFEDGSAFDLSNVSAVPVPAAAWLFGSGLLSLIGIARKKRTLA